MKPFKIRASALSQIMSNPKSKSDLLSKTAITHMNDYVDENYYNRRKVVKTWAMQKGTEKEVESLIILNNFLGTSLKKDKRKFSNDFATGHIDVDFGEQKTVYDIKICETFSTFPRFKEDPENAYYWQLQCYMWLMDYDKAVVAKVLVNSPVWQIKELIKRSYFSLLNKYGEENEQFTQDHKEEVEGIFAQHVFDQSIEIDLMGEKIKLSPSMVIPNENRVKLFTIDRCQEDIDKITPRVLECREFLKQQGY